jgi:tetratricopeptide (TPR) repeat protein
MAVRHATTGARLFPSWAEVLARAADELQQEQKGPYAALVRALVEIRPADNLEAAKRAREGLGPRWYEFLHEQFDITRNEVDADSLSLPRALWGLGSQLIITTNYDRVLQWSCPNADDLVLWDIESPAEQSRGLQLGFVRPTVWHLHGQVGNAAKMILTPDGYTKLYSSEHSAESYDAALQTLRSLLASHSFLFVGFSFNDTYFGAELQSIRSIYADSAGPHYVLAPESEVDLFRARIEGVEIIPFQNYGSPLTEYLRLLGESVLTGVPEVVSSSNMVAVTDGDYDPRKPVFSVPYRPKGKYLLGRDEALRQVREQLANGQPSSIGQTVGFQGIGGLGKTQLAVEYAWQFRDSYPNGVIWISADADIDAQLVTIAEYARWISPETEYSFKLEVARQRLRSFSDVLIVFDNVESLDDLRQYLPSPNATPHLLLTSRTDQPGFTPVPLNLLDLDVSVELLLQESGRHVSQTHDQEAASQIAKTLGGLPLALEIAGAFLRHRPISLTNYCALLQRNLREALSGRFLASFTNHQADLYSTLKIDEEIMEEEPLLRLVLDVLTWSGAAPMGISLLTALTGVKDSIELAGALSLGAALRLIQTAGTDRETYSIHRLVREVRREDVPLNQMETWARGLARSITEWFQARREGFVNRNEIEVESVHLREWRRHAEEFGWEERTKLTWLEAYPLFFRGQYRDAHTLVDEALAGFGLLPEEEQPRYRAWMTVDLASVVLREGNAREALRLAAEGVKLSQLAFGADSEDSINALDVVGAALSQLGKKRQSLEYAKRIADLRQSASEPDKDSYSMAQVNVAICYLSFGDNVSAIRVVRDVLANEGISDAVTSGCLTVLGEALEATGKLDLARQNLERAVELRRLVFGTLHPFTAESMVALGRVYTRLRLFDKAIEMEREALRINMELLGHDHLHTARALTSLVGTLQRFGRRGEAIRASDDFRRSLPPAGRVRDLIERERRTLFSSPARTSAKRRRK